MRRIAILGDYRATNPTHVATNAAIEHSTEALGLNVEKAWVGTDEISPGLFSNFNAIWVAPGSPYKDMNRALDAIKHAREHNVPCIGTCGGFQHMVLEYARNVLNIKDANHAEYNPNASNLFISQLECSLKGREMQLRFRPESQIARIYGGLTANEEYYCNFGIAPDKVALVKSGSLQVTGSDAEGEIRVIELPAHPFFIGTLFVPQTRSTAGSPHPLVNAFVRSVAGG